MSQGRAQGDLSATITLKEARRRWDAYRALIWLTLADVRGQRGRSRVLRWLRPGSWRFTVATSAAEPVFVLRRRLRRRSTPAPVESVAEFPRRVAELRAQLSREPWVEPRQLDDLDDDVTMFVLGTTSSDRPSPVEHSTLAHVSVVFIDESNGATGVVGQLNDALDCAPDWIMVLDELDVMTPESLEQMCTLGRRTDTDFVYGDELTTDEACRVIPIFRTPSLGTCGLLSRDATGRAVLWRREALRRVGGFDAGAGWAFRHDAVLRAREAGSTSAHLATFVVMTPPENPRYREALATSTAASLARLGLESSTRLDPQVTGLVRWTIAPQASWPGVAIVIPTRDRLDLLSACIASLETVTSYPNFEIIIVDNDSVEPATLSYFAACRYTVVPAPGPFNYASVMNRGVGATSAPFIVTLNNDVTIATEDWLEQMVNVARLPDVGVVGAWLSDPAGHSQHEGIAIAPYPQHLRRDRNYLVPDAFLASTREVSAVTGACQLVSRDLWDRLGGLDESLAVVHNDVDFCLRSWELARSVVYVPSVRLLHAESSSRGSMTPLIDVLRFIARWDIFGSFRDRHFPAQLELVGDEIQCRLDDN